MQETLNYSAELSNFLEVAVERAIADYDIFLKAKTDAKDINPIVCFAITNYMYEVGNDIVEVLDCLWDIKTSDELELSKDDIDFLDSLIDIIKSDRINACQKIQSKISRTLTMNELSTAKANSIITALNETFDITYIYGDEEGLLEKVLEKEYCVEKGITGTLTVDEVFLDDFGKYMVNKIFNSFEFIKNYLKTWERNDYDSITKIANNVLNKYKEDKEKFNELKEIISYYSSSYVYDKNFKQFIFLDNCLAGHVDSILKFVARGMGYDDSNQIPIKMYPKCDEYIRKNIEIKGQNNSTTYSDIFK